MQLSSKRSSTSRKNNWFGMYLVILFAIPLSIFTMLSISLRAAGETAFDGIPRGETVIMVIAGVALFLASRHRNLRR